MEKPSFDQMFRRTGKFQDSSGGLTCSEEQENSKDSIWWASEKRKTKKPRFVSFGFGWIGFDFGLWAFDSIGCDILGAWALDILCFLTNSRFFNVDGEI
ncbi:unnamed protein product [Rhizophagus irregularis]|nr:unnamed protein product [Rhizophagus irregularis]